MVSSAANSARSAADRELASCVAAFVSEVFARDADLEASVAILASSLRIESDVEFAALNAASLYSLALVSDCPAADAESRAELAQPSTV